MRCTQWTYNIFWETVARHSIARGHPEAQLYRSSFRRPASRTWLYITVESSWQTCDKSCSLRLSKTPALSYTAITCSFPILTAMFTFVECLALTASLRKSMLSTAAFSRQPFISDGQSLTFTRERNSLILSLTSTYLYEKAHTMFSSILSACFFHLLYPLFSWVHSLTLPSTD